MARAGGGQKKGQKKTEAAGAAAAPAGARDIEAYTHDGVKRANNPPAALAQYDAGGDPGGPDGHGDASAAYAFDPHLDPALDWAGKKEGLSFDVPTCSIHIHESIKPHKILRAVQAAGGAGDGGEGGECGRGGRKGVQPALFEELETPLDRMRRRRAAIEFYRHGLDWTNRLIAGDSLIVMNSLLEKEGMAGRVQMIYIDPPYGIKYGSNFQPFVNKRDVKDGRDEDLAQEPETVTAFRDTWELGVHSYLSYLRNRLLLTRELLADSGSVFVQISDENVHLVRCLCDEVFGVKNFVSMISYATTGGFATKTLSRVGDYILWYAKDMALLKYRQLFFGKTSTKAGLRYDQVELADGTRRALSRQEIAGGEPLPKGAKVFQLDNTSSNGLANGPTPVVINGIAYHPPKNCHWKANYPDGMNRLISCNRIAISGNSLRYVRYFDDFPHQPITNTWQDIGGAVQSRADPKVYVVQTGTSVIQRCLLMATDPGDLVLDITCGSGTTAYVAEQWGRRWITCDTSRVAIALAKKRLMTAAYDYYRLADEGRGVAGGFIYKTVPHDTLKSIANNEPPAAETLYDQPEVDKSKVRVSGPFTVEALPAPLAAPTVRPLDDPPPAATAPTAGARKQSDWRDELLATGIRARGGAKIEFSRVEPLVGTHYLSADAETREDVPRRTVVCFAGETNPMDVKRVNLALDEAMKQLPRPDMVVFAAFHFDPVAAEQIGSYNWQGVQLLMAQMNTDLLTGDLKKKRSSNQSFWLVGQPDVDLIEIEKAGPKNDGRGKYKVRVNGYDYYDARRGVVDSGDAKNIAMWMLDTDYDDARSVEPRQVFFPMDGKEGGWARLARTLRAEMDHGLLEAYADTESLPFEAAEGQAVAVKIIDDRGIESLKVMRVGT
jgi:adenine-specific DNA-methyltransferase